jgi:hypothetical protein
VKDNNRCILFFVRAPVGGQVKTRLAADIGGERAVALYRCFGRDLIGTLDAVDAALVCCFHPPERRDVCAAWLGSQRVFQPQQGQDLGQRMAHALHQAFQEGRSKVLLIGSDSPDLPVEFLDRAFAALDEDEAVIGPSSDGGYYLIGFTAQGFLPAAFVDVRWGTGDVFERTIGTLRHSGRRTFLLPRWHDVDSQSDLRELICRNAMTAFRRSKTFAFARQCGWTD